MKIFVSGGCKSGKSRYAQSLAVRMRQASAPLYYLATMIPTDEEDVERIARHRTERADQGFETIEAGQDIAYATARCDPTGTFLLDSVTALLANEMFDRHGNRFPGAAKKVAAELSELATKFERIIFVSDYIYSDARFYDAATEEYREGLAAIDRTLVRRCDRVLELCAGNVVQYK